MSELSPSDPTPRDQKATVRAARIGAEQWGVIGARQLHECGVSSSAAHRWQVEGKLHVIHRGVYALGHPAVPVEGRLVAALIHAGPRAALSHATAAWWWGLVSDQPRQIHVSSLSRVRSVRGVVVHHPRRFESTRHRRFPVTTVARTLVDLAAGSTEDRVRRALAEAEFLRLLDVGAVRSLLGPGRGGSSKLRRALARHEPQLALARSILEERFLGLCESAEIPLPELNARVEGLMVDALWRPHRLVVELDGHAAHSSPAQIERDRGRELRLRAAGLQVIRYTWRQIAREREVVIADMRAALSAHE